MPRQVTVGGILFIHRVDNVVDDAVVAPGEPSTVKSHFAITEHMVCCLTTFAQLAQVRRGLLPSFEIGSSWESDLKFVGIVGTGGPVKFFLAV